MFKDLALNKKHKGIKKRLSGMGFENFSGRVKSLVNFEMFEKPPAEYKEVLRLSVVQGKMIKKTVVKTKNNKRFYFPDGSISLPFGHRNLKQIYNFKKEKVQKIEKYFWEEKEVLFKMGKEALKNNPRFYLYHQIILSSLKIFNINQKNDFIQQNKTLLKRSTKDTILSGEWIE